MTMSTNSPVIHVLDKDNYSKHRLVSLPDAKLTQLAPSSIRFQSKILGQTTNNLTYARLGTFLGWYDTYPLPKTTPAPFNNSDTYGRISAWGYAEIVESTVPEISPGQSIFGYLPIGTGIETARIEFASHNGKRIDNQIIVLDEHRQHLWRIYNRYQLCAPLSELEKNPGLDSLGYDALMSVLFGTSFNLNRYAFAWDARNLIHPSGQGDWSMEDADLRGATVIILNASGKTGMSFAHCLRSNRPKEHQTTEIIGVGSEASVSFIKASNLYDQVVLNTDFESTKTSIEQSQAKRVVLFDFGARPGAVESWFTALSSSTVPLTSISVGGEVKIQDPEAAKKFMADRGKVIVVNANVVREKGIAMLGQEYFEDFDRAFDEFKGLQQNLRLVWGEGMQAWIDGWEGFCSDEIKADMGMVYRV